ncbi:MAG: hypothetical protein P1P64_07895 [Treponemataceae bacterium]
MKKTVISVLLVVFCANLFFASEVTALLDQAKEEYSKGNYEEAIKYIDSAKKLIENEQLAKGADDYLLVEKWDVIDLKSDFYIGKKVKFVGRFYGALNKDEINIGARGCTFDKSLVDKILTLKDFTNYTFYGVVKAPKYTSGNPYLHVEMIE